MKKKIPRDEEYEVWLGTELFKLGLLFYDKVDVGSRMGKENITVTSSLGHGKVRDRIRENLDFLNMTIKYSLMDLDATRRELAGKM